MQRHDMRPVGAVTEDGANSDSNRGITTAATVAAAAATTTTTTTTTTTPTTITWAHSTEYNFGLRNSMYLSLAESWLQRRDGTTTVGMQLPSLQLRTSLPVKCK